MTHAAPYVVTLAALGVLAAVLDVRARRIPNLLTIGIAAVGLSAQLVTGGLAGAVSGVVAGILVSIALWPLWRKRGIGGGDLKLAAAFAIAAGLALLPQLALASALAGGVVSLVYYLASPRAVRRAIRTTIGWTLTMRELPEVPATARRVSVPYGAAIAAGAVLTMMVFP